MRSFLFSIAYWVLSTFYVLAAALAALLPGRGPVTWLVRRYCRRMLWAMRTFAGITVNVRGRERLPEGPFLVAAKHHSWGDGFVMFADIPNLSFVTGDHLENYPLMSTLLKKLGAIVVKSCGGPKVRAAMIEESRLAFAEGRRILIYPEGHLAAPGERFEYKPGIYHMYHDFNLPVVPVATNLGLFWNQTDWKKTPGTATVEYLDPIPPGLNKAAFMARLEAVTEAATNALIAEATGKPIQPAILVKWDGNKRNVPVETPGLAQS